MSGSASGCTVQKLIISYFLSESYSLRTLAFLANIRPTVIISLFPVTYWLPGRRGRAVIIHYCTKNYYSVLSGFLLESTNSLDSSALPTWISPQSNRDQFLTCLCGRYSLSTTVLAILEQLAIEFVASRARVGVVL